jgi:serine-type D-Ala-D-Ala carboxypeptidase (penicillin-binding protein 5/6)
MKRLVLSITLCGIIIACQTVPAITAVAGEQSATVAVTQPKPKVTVGKKQNSSTSTKKQATTGKSLPQSTSGGPSISADSAVLIDAGSGQIIFAKQPHKHRAPASTTKIMTTILALEYGDLEKVITVSDKAGSVGQATLHLDPGEKISLGNLVEGALIKSGNDACVAIAENIAGDEATFVSMMNRKARALGAFDTNFENTNGLPNSKHYSSAYDLALMARYGMTLPRFADTIRKKEAAIKSIDPKSTLPIRNTNKLLWMYEFADGVKTGTTNAAGKCLVSSATKNGRQLIAVVLDAPGRFEDSIRLLEYGFNNFESIKLAEAGDEAAKFQVYEADINEIPVVYGNAIEYLGKKAESVNVERKLVWSKPQIAPIEAGEQLGEVQYWLKGQLIAQAPLYATKTAKSKNIFKRLISGAK